MKLNRLFLIGTLGLAMGVASCDKDDDEQTSEMTNSQDQTFVMQAGMSNKAEVEMGTLATTMASDSSVKAFAQMMVTEHTTAQTELTNLADDVDITIKDSTSASNVALKDSLSGLSGTNFDQAYIQTQMTAHQQTLSVFDAEISGGGSAKVKSYASKYRPKIQVHLDSATAIYNRIK